MYARLTAAALRGVAPPLSAWPSMRGPPMLKDSALSSSCSCKRTYTSLGDGRYRPQMYTKYRLTKPFSEDTEFDDIVLAEPERSELATTVKEGPVFLRFLNLVTAQEGRQKAFVEFAKRCEKGLLVEKDVYVTKSELLDCLWDNGWSEMELNAYEIAFPADYQFHYPELAVLFNLTEEDCYKYCIRKRAAAPDALIEIRKRDTKHVVATYGLLSAALWFGLQNNTLGNMWMFVKTWPFLAVFYMLGSHFQRKLLAKVHASAKEEERVSTKNKLDGEEAIYQQLRKYAKDSNALEYLQGFKGEVERDMSKYRAALLREYRDRLIKRAQGQLSAIRQQERAVAESLQQTVVGEVLKAVKHQYLSDEQLQRDSFDAAIFALEASSDQERMEGAARSGAPKVPDPIGDRFRATLQALSKNGFPDTTPGLKAVVEKVQAAFAEKETEFLRTFAVSAQDAMEIAAIVQQILVRSGKRIVVAADLQDEDIQRLMPHYQRLAPKVGLDPDFETEVVDKLRIPTVDSQPAKEYLESVKTEVLKAIELLRRRKLASFAQNFVSF